MRRTQLQPTERSCRYSEIWPSAISTTIQAPQLKHLVALRCLRISEPCAVLMCSGIPHRHCLATTTEVGCGGGSSCATDCCEPGHANPSPFGTYAAWPALYGTVMEGTASATGTGEKGCATPWRDCGYDHPFKVSTIPPPGVEAYPPGPLKCSQLLAACSGAACME